MPDTIYRVRVQYDADAKRAHAEINKLGHEATESSHMLRELGRELTGLDLKGGLGQALGTGIAFGAIELIKSLGESIREVFKESFEFLKGTVEAAERLESTKISFGALFTAYGLESTDKFKNSLAGSQELIKLMREDAVKLPGTFQDLNVIMQRITGPGLTAGKTLREIEGMSTRLMAASKVMGLNPEDAGREMAAIMEGRINPRNALFAKLRMAMSEVSGKLVTPESFKAMDTGKQFDLILQTLKKFDPAIEEYSKTWTAVKTTAQDHLTQIKEAIGEGLMSGLTDGVQSFNDWFQANKDEIIEWARNFGEVLKQGIGFAVDKFKELKNFVQEGTENLIRAVSTHEEYLNYIHVKSMLRVREMQSANDRTADELVKRVDTILGKNTGNLLDKRVKPVSNQHTTVHNDVKIVQTINEAENADRVLIMTKKALKDALFHPVENPSALSASVIKTG